MRFSFFLILCILGCSDEQIPAQERPKYYFEARITNNTHFGFRIYKMRPFLHDTSINHSNHLYLNFGLPIYDSLSLSLTDENGNTSDTVYDKEAINNTSYLKLHSLKGQPNTYYTLSIGVGKDTLNTSFYIPDSFVVDTYQLNSRRGSESLKFELQLPKSYFGKDHMVFTQTIREYTAEPLWDFCEITPAINAQTVEKLGYLDLYSYADCTRKQYFNNGSHEWRMWYFNRFFKPNRGQYLNAMPQSTYLYLKDLNQHIDGNLKGTSYPINMPSMFNSGVFYGGIVAYYSRHVLFSER